VTSRSSVASRASPSVQSMTTSLRLRPARSARCRRYRRCHQSAPGIADGPRTAPAHHPHITCYSFIRGTDQGRARVLRSALPTVHAVARPPRTRGGAG
jgi:hypothetical protein